MHKNMIMKNSMKLIDAHVKRFFLSGLILLSLNLSISAQTAGANVKTSSVVELYDEDGKPMSTPGKKNVTGSPMLNPDWGSGTIFFKNGKVTTFMEIQLNLQKNELYFRREGKSFMFSDTVTGFRIIYALQDLVYNDIFRSGYPETGRNKATHFYQLLVEGNNIQLLADRSKQLVDAYTYSGGEKSTYREDEVLYVFDVAKQKMTEIKNMKNAKSIISAAFPDRKNDINRICDQQKSGIKTREDLVVLVKGLQ
jgi:hypothetical protein